MKKIWKKLAIAAGVVLAFLALSYGFVPQVLDGKIVNQSDISGYIGMSHEMAQWNKENPDNPTYWTDSMFGGMPTTAISTQNKGDYTQWIYDLMLSGKRPASYLFIALLGAFLMFLAFGVSWPVAIGGAIAVAFCSYNFQIIQVGHNTKMQAIAFMPWVLAALAWTYKQKGLWKTVLGAALFGLALSMQMKANHQQITYYLAIMILIYVLVELAHVIKNKDWKPFLLASGLLLMLGVAGIATNVNKLLPLAKYTPNTMRGGSELTSDGAVKGGGLDLDYATAWSYGWEELPNMMIPDFNGGASAGSINPEKSETIKLLRQAGQKNLKETAKALPLYWGPQPFTAGPMYMGAISVFLFVLGLFLYKGRRKWWLLAATVIAVLMAVGSHFMWFTKLCFNYLPLYNKFRTVSMALVVLQISLPLLGFITLDGILKGNYKRKEFFRALWWSLGLTGGFCLVAWIAPGLFGSFSGASDEGMQDILVDALVKDRIALFRADAFSSLLLILATTALLGWAVSGKGKTWIATAGICAIVCVNMFVIGKRYLNADHFTTPKDFNKPFAERPVDTQIKADDSPSYRVLDLTVNVFNSSVPSYHHKTVGGYSPAKLQRYQDLIEHYLAGEINGLYKVLSSGADLGEVSEYMEASTPVINALNTKYLILDGNYPPVENESAFGTAWFVDEAVPAATPDEEIAFIGSVDLRRQAVVSSSAKTEFKPSAEGDYIEMISYAPNELHYRYSAAGDRLAVFSEIYYPNGWKASVDGAPLELIRADWTLRAACLPAGEHEVVMRFSPDSYRVGASISRWVSLLLLLLTVTALAVPALSARRRTA